MYLLTQGTLLFLDLDLVPNAKAGDKGSSLNSAVQKWADEVAAATDDPADDVDTTCSMSSTTLPTFSSVIVGLTSPISVASEPTPQNAPTIFNYTCPGEHPLTKFSPLRVDEDDDATEIATLETLVTTSGMVSPPSDSGSDLFDSGSPFSQRLQDSPRGVKRKIDNTDIVSESEVGADHEEPVSTDASTGSKLGRTHTSSTTLVSVKSRPRKRVSCEKPSLSLGRIPTACTAQPQSTQGRLVDNEGYVIETIKNHSEYTTKDLPVPCDQRWSQSFLSTAILWYSVQNDILNVPKDQLASALQRIFDVVYPHVKYRVTIAGSVYSLTLQRIHSWHTNFASSALAMMRHFFSALDVDDPNDGVAAAASFLATDFRFLRANPDACAPTELFRSPFLLILLAIAHLGEVAACVGVPGWDTRAMVAGEGGEGVVGIASAALERALSSFTCNSATVPVAGRRDSLQQLHELTYRRRRPTPEPPDSTVLSRSAALGRDRGSGWSWADRTVAYRAAVSERGRAFVRETFAAAWAKQRRIGRGEDEEGDGGRWMGDNGSGESESQSEASMGSGTSL